MKLIYLTSKSFPSKKVEPFIIKSMANAFGNILGDDFILFIRGKVPNEFNHIKTTSVRLPNRFKAFSYFIVLPWVLVTKKWTGQEIVFFSSDPYLLAILVFWRKVFGFKYRICSEWHQLFDDWRDRYVAKNSDYLISTSKRLRHFISLVSGINERKILVPYGGFDEVLLSQENVSKDVVRGELNLPKGKFLVGYAGAYRAMSNVEKGISTMIKSLPFLNQEIGMIFVGGKPDEIIEYSKLTKDEGVENRCRFIGKQRYSGLIKYEKAMDALVIANPDTPYYRNYCFPFKVWEYMASGRPIIYSNLEIIDEILSGRGYPFEVGSPESLASTILLVKNDIKSAEEMSKKNPQIAQSYTWQNRAREIIKYIKS